MLLHTILIPVLGTIGVLAIMGGLLLIFFGLVILSAGTLDMP